MNFTANHLFVYHYNARCPCCYIPSDQYLLDVMLHFDASYELLLNTESNSVLLHSSIDILDIQCQYCCSLSSHSYLRVGKSCPIWIVGPFFRILRILRKLGTVYDRIKTHSKRTWYHLSRTEWSFYTVYVLSYRCLAFCCTVLLLVSNWNWNWECMWVFLCVSVYVAVRVSKYVCDCVWVSKYVSVAVTVCECVYLWEGEWMWVSMCVYKCVSVSVSVYDNMLQQNRRE